MALHTTLPIHKAGYDLYGVIVDMVRNLPRSVKRTLGDRMEDRSMELLLLVGRANTADNKVPFIEELLEQLQAIELMLRTCLDKRFISRGQWARAIEITDSIGKQAGGWRKQSARAAGPTPPMSDQPSLFAASPAA